MEALVLVAIVVAVVIAVSRRGSSSGGSRSAPVVEESRAEPVRDYGKLVRLAGWDRVRVTGESHYQPALRACVQGRSSRGYEDAVRVQAVLVPEPSNPHDRHAVRVDVDRRTVGYLPRGDAERYQPLLRRLRGRTGWCVGRVTGGGDRHYGIYLQLAPPDAVVPVNDPGDLMLIEGGRHVTVTKLDQEAVAPLTQGVLLPATVFVSLAPVSIERGKYAGQDTWEVRVDGRRVGEITKRMADRYASVLSGAEEPVGCETVIDRDDRGFHLSLMLPQVDE